MHQVGIENLEVYEDETFTCGRFIVGCCRKDCEIKGFTEEPHGEVELAPAFQYLLEE